MTRVKITAKKEKAQCHIEDDVAFTRNPNALQAETRKSKPNPSAMTQLMDVTFEIRRNEIENSPKHVKYFLDKFPSLTIYDQVKHTYYKQ